MNKLFKNCNRLTLVSVTTLLSIILTLLVIIIGYKLMGVKIRQAEIIIGICAPLLVAPMVTWYLYGLIKKLDALEQRLRLRITREKEDVYSATIHGTQHVVNNLLNGLTLVDMELENHPSFNKKILDMFHEMLSESKKLIEDLSSVKLINAKEIKESVAPKSVVPGRDDSS